MIQIQRTRRGMTLVEVLVAAAMCIMGMWLLSWLCGQAGDSFRQARSQAALTNTERMVAAQLARDIQQPHFSDQDDKPNRGRRVSDQRLDQAYLYPDPTDVTGTRMLVGGYTPPRGGYFRAGSVPFRNDIPAPLGNPYSLYEAIDGNGLSSSRSGDHFIQMTVLLPGGSNFHQFSAEVPAGSTNQYFSTAAEVSYYLVPAGFTPGGVQLFDLYRRQRIVGRTPDDAPAYNGAISAAVGAGDNANEVMVVKPGNQMASLYDLTIPAGFPNSTRFAGPAFSYFGAGNTPTMRYGEDKLMSNVLSFEIKFTGPTFTMAPVSGQGMWPSDPNSNQWPRTTVRDPGGVAIANADYPYDNLPFDGIYDTFSTRAITPVAAPGQPLPWNTANNLARIGNNNATMKPLRLTGIQIRLRVFDSNTRQTRQTTMVFDI